jgi:acyl-CoA synthetase (AMP-forming)/AMP-acid ligase II
VPDLPDATYLSDFHQHRAEQDPDGRCWTYLDRTWTWAQAWDDVRRFAGALQAEGITRGDRIAFLDKNNPAILMATQASCLSAASRAWSRRTSAWSCTARAPPGARRA